MTKLYPFLLEPVYKDYVWGGKKIAKHFHRKQLTQRCAESWEVSDRSDGMSLITNGAYRGYTLHKLEQELGSKLLGTACSSARFPLLIKLIDAAENLSVQVHPNDKDAALLGAEAKSECWVVLDAEEDAAVYAGLKKGVTQRVFEEACKQDRVLECLEKIPVQEGDVIYVPGGCVHAILSGCLLLEVQQNSNTTYRIYDWGRGRDLHLEKALQVIQWDLLENLQKKPELISSSPQQWSLITCPYFSIQKIEIKQAWTTPVDPKGFQVFFCLSGNGEVEVQQRAETYREGMSCLIAAASEQVTWTPTSPSILIRITLNLEK